MRTRTPTNYLDFKLDPGAQLSQPVTKGDHDYTSCHLYQCIVLMTGWNGFIYTLEGVGQFGGPDKWTESEPHHTLVLGEGDHVEVKNEVGGVW